MSKCEEESLTIAFNKSVADQRSKNMNAKILYLASKASSSNIVDGNVDEVTNVDGTDSDSGDSDDVNNNQYCASVCNLQSNSTQTWVYWLNLKKYYKYTIVDCKEDSDGIIFHYIKLYKDSKLNGTKCDGWYDLEEEDICIS